MMLDTPVDFIPAIKTITEKKLLPTSLSSAEINELNDEFDIRGLFSARTLSAQLLSGYQDELKELASGQINQATARVQIKDLIDELGGMESADYQDAGTIKDLGSNSRIALVLRTNLDMARGFGQYAEGMTEGAFQAYPALELIRVEERNVPRDWEEIWDDAAEELGDQTRATSAEETGRMVAAKGDPIWLAISDFNQPWPPFKFNSGMGVEDVDYQDAMDLGVIDEDEIPEQPEALDFNEGVESSVAEMAPEIVKVLGEGLEGIAKQVGNVFEMLTTPKAKPKIANDARAIRNRVTHVLSLLEEAA